MKSLQICNFYFIQVSIRYKLVDFLIKKFNDLPKHLFKSFFQCSIKDMGKFVLRNQDPKKYGAPEGITVLKKRKASKPNYKLFSKRFIVTRG